MTLRFVVLHSFIVVAAACGDNHDAGPDAASTETDAPGAGDLPSYVVPVDETMAAITIDPNTGTFYVDSASSGKIFRGRAGATTDTPLELFADLGTSGLGHLALTPDGRRLVILSALGAAPEVVLVDTTNAMEAGRIALPASGGLAAAQDIVVAPDGIHAYATNPFTNVIYAIDLDARTSTTFAISSEFPFISDASLGFLNASGLAITPDGNSLIVAHLIDKHLYRISLDANTLGQAAKIDTAPYNVSGNGLWLDDDGSLLEVAGDELRVFRFALAPDGTTGELASRYADVRFEAGLTYAVRAGDRILVLNGSGVAATDLGGGGNQGGGGGGGNPDGGMELPPELVTACDGKAMGDACSATLAGMSITGTCAPFDSQLACIPQGGGGGMTGPDGGSAMPKYPIRVLQLPL
ncbi:MAG: hypothetical protein SFX73_26380 [Kofleriaceae bacterium]|nr:hypothetical protein [Kofleriaceae bacterium]